MKVTVLIDNKSGAKAGLVSEWGLSLHIAFNGRSILFDTGSSGSFVKNAEQLSLDIASVDAAVLSHHHFDHGGGLRNFLECNSGAKLYLGERPDGDCTMKIFLFFKKYIGLDKGLFEEYPGRFVFVGEPAQILPDVYIFPHISINHRKPRGNRILYLSGDRHLTRDDFTHEIVMAIKENGKLLVITGCSHNGILNMLDTVAKQFAGVPIKAVIGGFHMVGTPPFNKIAGGRQEVEDIGRAVLNYPVETSYTGHCTGTKAFDVLKGVMGERLKGIETGMSFEV